MIFVVPHTWAVDMIGRYFQGIKMCTMMKSPKDAVFDWYINRERSKGGRIYERSVGIKPAIKAPAAATAFSSAGSGSRPGGEPFVPFLQPPPGDPAGPALSWRS